MLMEIRRIFCKGLCASTEEEKKYATVADYMLDI